MAGHGPGNFGVFERFTEQGGEVVVDARREARGLRHGYVGSEHLLLGLLREEDGLAARVLASFDATLESARVQVVLRVGSGEGPPSFGPIRFRARGRCWHAPTAKRWISVADT